MAGSALPSLLSASEFVSKDFSKAGQPNRYTGVFLTSPTPSSQPPALYLLGEKELINQKKIMTRHSAR